MAQSSTSHNAKAKVWILTPATLSCYVLKHQKPCDLCVCVTKEIKVRPNVYISCRLPGKLLIQSWPDAHWVMAGTNVRGKTIQPLNSQMLTISEKRCLSKTFLCMVGLGTECNARLQYSLNSSNI